MNGLSNEICFFLLLISYDSAKVIDSTIKPWFADLFEQDPALPQSFTYPAIQIGGLRIGAIVVLCVYTSSYA
jgi:hypothetical protein